MLTRYYYNVGSASQKLGHYYNNLESSARAQQTWDGGPTLVYCWPTVYDVGPTVNQRWAMFVGGCRTGTTIRWTNAGLMFLQRRRRWANIKSALVQRLVQCCLNVRSKSTNIKPALVQSLVFVGWFPESTKYPPNAGLMLGLSRRQWNSINTALCQCIVFTKLADDNLVTAILQKATDFKVSRYWRLPSQSRIHRWRTVMVWLTLQVFNYI